MAKNLTGMKNREFLMLAETYDSKKQGLGDWYCSEKLDGMRCLWDGGITTGLNMSEVPWSNRIREAGNRVEGSGNERICTGLWSRYGKPIHAPEWFVRQLRDNFPYPLDGELWIGKGQFQNVMSAVKKLDPVDSEWERVKFMVFDAPSYQQVFADGMINGTNYVQMIDSKVRDWVINRIIVDPKRVGLSELVRFGLGYTFHTNYMYLEKVFRERIELDPTGLENIRLHVQVRLPVHTIKAQEEMLRLLELVTADGGEGLILRDPHCAWMPKRNEWMVKIKKLEDMEGTVINYRWGKGKLEGLMGSCVVKLDNGKVFELSGFTDAERKMSWDRLVTVQENMDFEISGDMVPGGEIRNDITNSQFPRGSRITFCYRELTNDGMPKEARYLRKRID